MLAGVEMGKSWKEYWNDLLEKNKLVTAVNQMNIIDASNKTEKICRNIYGNYNDLYENLIKVHNKLVVEINEAGKWIYLHSSRIKSMDSLIVKVIQKRYQNINSKTSRYAILECDNYKNIITDLIGVRLIISERGKWKELHKAIVNKFPMLSDYNYEEGILLPHQSGINCLAEKPKAYYVRNDDNNVYHQFNIQPVLSKEGYRSIHYILSYDAVYVEIQVRNIYDEAWCNCSHNYVYKQEVNPSNRALKQISLILSDLTNVSSDLEAMMKEVFDGRMPINANGEKFVSSTECINYIEDITSKMERVNEKMNKFKNSIINS